MSSRVAWSGTFQKRARFLESLCATYLLDLAQCTPRVGRGRARRFGLSSLEQLQAHRAGRLSLESDLDDVTRARLDLELQEGVPAPARVVVLGDELAVEILDAHQGIEPIAGHAREKERSLERDFVADLPIRAYTLKHVRVVFQLDNANVVFEDQVLVQHLSLELRQGEEQNPCASDRTSHDGASPL
ncbi:MAG: hypothetical protein AB1486_27385 [Planctomycetota bacterium]